MNLVGLAVNDSTDTKLYADTLIKIELEMCSSKIVSAAEVRVCGL